MKSSYIVILVTASSQSEAEKIAKELLEKQLIACANIVEGVTSFFCWGEKIDRSREVLMILKTQKSKFKLVEKQVKQLHSYSVPEIIALPIIEGNKEYLKWLQQSTKSS